MAVYPSPQIGGQIGYAGLVVLPRKYILPSIMCNVQQKSLCFMVNMTNFLFPLTSHALIGLLDHKTFSGLALFSF